MNIQQTAIVAGQVAGGSRDIYQFASASKAGPKMFASVTRPNLNFGWSGEESFAPSAPLRNSNQVSTLQFQTAWERWAFSQSMTLRLRQQQQQQHQDQEQRHQDLFQMAGHNPFAPQRFLEFMEFKHGEEQEPSTSQVPGPRRGFDNVKNEPDCWVCP